MATVGVASGSLQADSRISLGGAGNVLYPVLSRLISVPSSVVDLVDLLASLALLLLLLHLVLLLLFLSLRRR